MSIDDIYNNFKIVEQEVKRIASSNSSSQNMAFVSSPSTNSTNEVHTAYGKNGNKITINGSDTSGFDKSKVECYNCHKMGHFVREYRGPRNQDSRNMYQDSSRRTVHEEEIPPKAMVVIDGVGFDWSYMAKDEVPTNMALIAFQTLRVPNNKDCSVESPIVVEKKIFVRTIAKVKVVRPKQQEKPVRKIVRYAEMYKSQGHKGNQRNWNNLKSQQQRSNFVMYNKAYFVCGSFKYLQANCNYHEKKRVVSRNNYTRVTYNNSTRKTHPSPHRKMALRAVLMKTGLRPLNPARPINTAHPKTTV
uniref:Ribonuclease H-like domain-containing protein n=1 Tax=Tanacetum cinerariifolium TaxID=118510 RepID=A0A699L9V3_TANCI|nr:ribonuclease H-like domain-containing protein [Tanacetum cinerariifolium]